MKIPAFILCVFTGLIGSWLWINRAQVLDPPQHVAPEQLVEAYTDWIARQWTQAWLASQELQSSAGRFVAQPNPATLSAVRESWRAAQNAWKRAEVFSELLVEPALRRRVAGWPLDEGLLDYVDEARYAPINADQLSRANLVRNDAVAGNGMFIRMKPVTPEYLLQLADGIAHLGHVATGLHALEFILWGQAGSQGEPGQRPLSDFASTDESCTTDPRAPAGMRLRECRRRVMALQALSARLAADFEAVVTQMRAQPVQAFGPLRKRSDAIALELLGSLGRQAAALQTQALAAERIELLPNEFSAETRRFVAQGVDAMASAWRLEPGVDEIRSLRAWARWAAPDDAKRVGRALSSLESAVRDMPAGGADWLVTSEEAAGLRERAAELSAAIDRLIQAAIAPPRNTAFSS